MGKLPIGKDNKETAVCLHLKRKPASVDSSVAAYSSEIAMQRPAYLCYKRH